jgi:hypothetical protein
MTATLQQDDRWTVDGLAQSLPALVDGGSAGEGDQQQG